MSNEKYHPILEEHILKDLRKWLLGIEYNRTNESRETQSHSNEMRSIKDISEASPEEIVYSDEVGTFALSGEAKLTHEELTRQGFKFIIIKAEDGVAVFQVYGKGKKDIG